MESERIRHAQRQCLHLAVLRSHNPERIGVDVARQQDVLAETEGVVMIDVIEIQHVGAEIRLAFERRTGLGVLGPPFRTLLTRCRRTIQYLALAAIETEDLVHASPVLPHNAVTVDRDASRVRQRRHRLRRLIHFGLA